MLRAVHGWWQHPLELAQSATFFIVQAITVRKHRRNNGPTW